LTDFHFWGTDLIPGIDGFTFEIWANEGTGPGSMLYSEYLSIGGLSSNFVETNAYYNYDVFKYGFDLATPFTPETVGKYWFTVYADENPSTFTNHWYWAMSESFSGQYDWVTVSEVWMHTSELGETADFAFELTTYDAVVPEPTTLLLLGLGLMGIGVYRRK
jgi:hypothetical protein